VQVFVADPLRFSEERLATAAFNKMTVCDEKKNASYRLATFDAWPMEFAVSKRALAAAGFYYLQYGDNVKCAYCSLEMVDWKEGDDPMKDHERYSPRCPFVRAARDFHGDIELARKMTQDECGCFRT